MIKVDRNWTKGNCRKGKILFEPLNYPTLTITEIFVICSNQNNFCSPTSRLWFANLISQTTETSSVFFKFSYSCGSLIRTLANCSFYLSPCFLNRIWYRRGRWGWGAKKHLAGKDFEHLWPLPTIEIKKGPFCPNTSFILWKIKMTFFPINSWAGEVGNKCFSIIVQSQVQMIHILPPLIWSQ